MADVLTAAKRTLYHSPLLTAPLNLQADSGCLVGRSGGRAKSANDLALDPNYVHVLENLARGPYKIIDYSYDLGD
jgi:hypothetical protein